MKGTSNHSLAILALGAILLAGGPVHAQEAPVEPVPAPDPMPDPVPDPDQEPNPELHPP